jgi:hypothetical protein
VSMKHWMLGAVAAIQVGAKLESNVRYHTLDGNGKDWAMSFCLQNLGIIKEDNRSATTTSTTSTSRSGRGGTSNAGDQGAHADSIGGNVGRLKDPLLMRSLLSLSKLA